MIRRTKIILVMRSSAWIVAMAASAILIVSSSRDLLTYRRAMLSDAALTRQLSVAKIQLRDARLRADSLRHMVAVPLQPWSLESLRRAAAQYNLRIVRVEPSRATNINRLGQVVLVALEGDLVSAVTFLRTLEQEIRECSILGASLGPKTDAGSSVVLSLEARFTTQ